MTTKKRVRAAASRKKAQKKPTAKKPARTRTKKREHREEGPRSWLIPLRSTTYMRLAPHEMAAGAAIAAPTVNDNVWVSRLSEFKQRKAAAVTRVLAAPPAAAPGAILTAPAAPTGGGPWGRQSSRARKRKGDHPSVAAFRDSRSHRAACCCTPRARTAACFVPAMQA